MGMEHRRRAGERRPCFFVLVSNGRPWFCSVSGGQKKKEWKKDGRAVAKKQSQCGSQRWDLFPSDLNTNWDSLKHKIRAAINSVLSVCQCARADTGDLIADWWANCNSIENFFFFFYSPLHSVSCVRWEKLPRSKKRHFLAKLDHARLALIRRAQLYPKCQRDHLTRDICGPSPPRISLLSSVVVKRPRKRPAGRGHSLGH